MGLLQGKRGLILGIANEKSIAYAVASLCREQGAELVLTYQNEATEKRVRPLAEKLNAPTVLPCDVAAPDDIERLFNVIEKAYGGVDFIVHSLAYADKEALKGRFSATPRDKFMQALDISAYSLIAIAGRARSLAKRPSSILTMSYLGAERVVPGYNLMGVAKAGLEASVRYLSYDLGVDEIRVNAVSAGPLRTLASSAISNLKTMIAEAGDMSPLHRPISAEDVAKASLYLLSDLSSGVTGEIHYVDGGYHIMGAAAPSEKGS